MNCFCIVIFRHSFIYLLLLNVFYSLDLEPFRKSGSVTHFIKERTYKNIIFGKCLHQCLIC